ncbi:MAG: DUF456 domain-containing protein [Bacteroidales bacterium]|nr:DUF456 domain-containing protein [Bacteroidales bacterium]
MDIDILWKVSGLALVIVGIIFSVLPVIPGQVVAWSALLLLQLTKPVPFSAGFLALWAFITAAVTLLDYFIPIWGTKKLGGSKQGIWGATLGLISGIFFFPPLGMIIGPFLGAFAGEMIAGKDTRTALKSGLGSFIGFVAGSLMKLAISVIMAYHFITAAF